MVDSPGFARMKRNPGYADVVQRTLDEQRRAISEVQAARVKAGNPDTPPRAMPNPKRKPVKGATRRVLP